MTKVRVKLLRPLNNQEVGAEVEYDRADAKRLESYGAVEIVGDAEPEPAAEKANPPAPANKAEGPSPSNKAESAAPARKAKASKATKGR